MRKYRVSTPMDGSFTIKADSGTQARYAIANKIRHTYPRLSISAISLLLSARLVKSKNTGAGRPKGSFNDMFTRLLNRNGGL